MTKDPVRIVVVDDHELAREGIRAVLTRAQDVDVVGEAASGEEALALAKSLQPELMLVDIRLGEGMDGLAVAEAVRDLDLTTKVIMLTLHDAAAYVRAALAAGASGYVLKDASTEDLLTTIDRVRKGHVSIPAGLLSQAVEPANLDVETRLDRLTAREREVLDGIAAGHTNKAIARDLGISPGTVKAHVERLIAKLGVLDRTQAAVLVTRAEVQRGYV